MIQPNHHTRAGCRRGRRYDPTAVAVSAAQALLAHAMSPRIAPEDRERYVRSAIGHLRRAIGEGDHR